jgi:hypothetical protein
MDQESLLLETLRELGDRLDSDREYDALMIAGLIRRLLTDQSPQPIMTQVNRNRRLRIRYLVNEYLVPRIRPGFHIWSIEDGFAPEPGDPPPPRPIPGAPPYPILGPREVSLDRLLKLPVMIWDGRYVSVKDVLESALYVQGAVHLGQPKDDDERSLAQLGTYFMSAQLPADLKFLRRLGRVVLRGLEPLRAQVASEQSAVVKRPDDD